MGNFWMENAYKHGSHVLVDLGNVNEQATRDRGDLVLTVIGRANFEIAGFNRLLVRVPPSKIKRLFAAYPIVEKTTYTWCSHSWLEAPAT